MKAELNKTNYYDIVSKNDDAYFNKALIHVLDADIVVSDFEDFIKRTNRLEIK